MNNDNIFFLVGTVVVITLVSLCIGLRKKQAEVDAVLTEQKSNQSSEKGILAENSNLLVKTLLGKKIVLRQPKASPLMEKH